MSECHSVWLSESIHITLKIILGGGRRITAKEAEQRKPLFCVLKLLEKAANVKLQP